MTRRGRTIDVIRALEQDPWVIEQTVRRARTDIVSYSGVPADAVAASVRLHLHRVAQTLIDGVVPASNEIWEAEKTTIERLRAGVPIEDMMGGFRVSFSCMEDRLVELAEEWQLDSAEVVRLTLLLWKLGDAFSAQVAATYRHQGVVSELADQRLKDDWLLSALTRGVAGDALERCLAVLCLDRDGTYVPFCARRTDAHALERIQLSLAEQLPGQICMVVPSGSQLIGLLAREPEPVADIVIAVGPATEPARLHGAFKVAARVLDATGTMDAGVYSLERLGWRLGVSADPQLSEFLRERYLVPLDTSRGSAEHIIEAVRTYLDRDLSIPRAAEALYVHVNTLRYRLARFEKLTGRSLSSTDTLIEVSWVLRHQQLSGS